MNGKKELFKIVYDEVCEDIILRVGKDFGNQFFPICSKKFLEASLEEVTPAIDEFDFKFFLC